VSKAKCYKELYEISQLFYQRAWDSNDRCGKEVSKKLKQIIVLLEKQEVYKR